VQTTDPLAKSVVISGCRGANLLVPATVASELDIHRTTITRYLALLETVFLIKTIPAWSGGGTHRAIGTPKIAFVDTGLLCHLLGQGPARLADPGGAAGPVLENFVLMELARQLTWNDERATLWHYRTTRTRRTAHRP
jgi:predicted AAA+ superfamily ATPase